MNNKVDAETRIRFRDWLRQQLRDLDFYQRRGDHYLIREFAKYCTDQGAPIDEASLGRYLRDDEPVLPTPERCRALGRVLELAPVLVLIEAGYLEGDDLFKLLPKNASPDAVAQEIVQRKTVLAEAAKGASEIKPLSILVEQIQVATDEMVERLAATDNAPEYQRALEAIVLENAPDKSAKATQRSSSEAGSRVSEDMLNRLASGNAIGPAAMAALSLREFTAAQQHVTPGELPSEAPAAHAPKAETAGRKRTTEAGRKVPS